MNHAPGLNKSRLIPRKGRGAACLALALLLAALALPTLPVSLAAGRGGNSTGGGGGAAAGTAIAAWGQNGYGQLGVPDPNIGFTAASGGTAHTLGLKADGSVAAWGRNLEGQCAVPAPNSGFTAVSAGSYHSLGLKADGSVAAWGYNNQGQANLPSPNSGFTAVSAGNVHSLGLKADGSIVGWGFNDYGQITVPSPNSGFVAVAGGYMHTLGLKADGSVVAWGLNNNGQCTVPAPNSGFIAVAAGYYHSFGLKADGSIVGWGLNAQGVLNIPAPNSGFTALATGTQHALGLKADGSIVAWGYNADGETNVPAPNSGFAGVACGDSFSLALRRGMPARAWGYNDSGRCDVPAPNSGFTAVAGGPGHSLGLKADGSVAGWGSNGYGQCNAPSPNSGFVSVAGGGEHSLGLKVDGSVVGWGDNDYGQCSPPAPNSGFTAVAAGYLHSLGLKTDGSIVGWGLNGHGQCNPPAPNSGFVAVAGGYLHGLGLRADGSVAAWGWNDDGQCSVPAPNSGFVAIAAGFAFSLGLKADGSVVAWGDNGSGQCSVPSPNSGFTAVAGGHGFSLGLKADGSVVGWGDNSSGQYTVPTPNAGYAAISAGYHHGLALNYRCTISASAGAGGSITPSGSVGVDYGANQAFTISPSAHYHVTNVLVDGVSQGAITSYTFSNVTTDHTISASFAIDQNPITASAGSNGSISPSGSIAVNYGANQTFTINPASHYHVANVLVDGVSQGAITSYTFTNVTAAHTISATFAIDQNPITASAGSNGSISPSGTVAVNYGSNQAFTITPSAHYHVANVLVDGSSVGAVTSYTFTNVTAAHTISASFAIDQNAITATAGSNGSISPSGTVMVDYGSNRAFTISPASHYHVADVLVDGSSVGAVTSYTFYNVTTNHTISASFAIDQNAITATAGSNGSISPSGTVMVDYGSGQSFTITPDPHYHIVSVLVDGVDQGAVTSYAFSNVTAAHTISASFSIDQNPITASAGPNGSITPSGEVMVDYGSDQTFFITPDPHYHVADVLADGVSVGAVSAVAFFNVTGPHTISASFSIDQNPITASAGPNGSITPSGEVMVDYGSDQTFFIAPDPHYHIVSVLVDGVDQGAVTSYNFSGVTAAHTIEAYFAIDTFDWYLAEGCTGEGFRTFVLVQNPNDYEVTVNLTLMTSEGPLSPPELQGVLLHAGSRATFDPGEFVTAYDLSTRVTSIGGDVVVERAVYDSAGAWGTDSIGTEAPSTTWYLAEGCTGEGFETYLLLLNPNPTQVKADITFMTSAGEVPGPQGYILYPESRATLVLHELVNDYDLSTVVTSTAPIVAERSVYGNGRAWAHTSIGATSPGTDWYLAEGSTGPGFETWVLVQNPGASPVSVDLTLMTGSGPQNPPALRGVVIPAHSRRSFDLGAWVTDYDVSTMVVGTGPVVCERACYGPDRAWGTCSVGAAAPAPTWSLAEGCTGPGFETWVLVQNPGAADVTVDLTFMTADGDWEGPRDVTVPAGSRISFDLGDYITNYEVSTIVTAEGGDVVCERAMYGNGRAWAHDSVGYAPLKPF